LLKQHLCSRLRNPQTVQLSAKPDSFLVEFEASCSLPAG
jgi:hypothetical protein